MLRFSEAFYVSSQHYDSYKCGASPKLYISIRPKPRRGASFVEKNPPKKSLKPRRGASFVVEKIHPKSPSSLGEAQVL
ncbi:MAG: hypothetical protein ACK4GN_06270 [Runella sp.]